MGSSTPLSLICLSFWDSFGWLKLLFLINMYWHHFSLTQSNDLLTDSFVLFLSSGLQSPPQDYGIHGTDASKIFSIIGATGTLVVSYNTGMIPEIQVDSSY